MAIHYDTVHHSTAKVSPALQQLKSINEAFTSEGISVLNEGFQEVVSNTHYYEDYISKLSEGLDPSAASEFTTIANNARMDILAESTISGVNPITALSLPMLRVAYPKTAIREGFPTEPVMQPKFKVTFLKPYMVNTAGEKVYLPAGLKTNRSALSLRPLIKTAITVGAAGLHGYDILTVSGGNSAVSDTIDPVFSISNVTFEAVNASGAAPMAVSVDCDIHLDTNINVCEGLVTGTHTDGTVNTVRVFAKVDRTAGTIDVVGLGRTVNSIKVTGYLSSEQNTASTKVGFDITASEVTIGTGQPVESPINIQQITDTMAMYNIDSTTRVLEVMATALAQNVDLQGIEFLEKQYNQSAQESMTFDLTPPANYALGDAAWREQIKTKIDNLVTRLMQRTNITSGSAVIFGNPLDTQVIQNVAWTYDSSETPNGVAVDYRVGGYTSGITTYRVLSSFNFAPGSLYVMFVPSAPDMATYKYYPYSFNVLRGVASNYSNNPAIQMIKRHSFNAYTSMLGKITLVNNHY